MPKKLDDSSTLLCKAQMFDTTTRIYFMQNSEVVTNITTKTLLASKKADLPSIRKLITELKLVSKMPHQLVYTIRHLLLHLQDLCSVVVECRNIDTV